MVEDSMIAGLLEDGCDMKCAFINDMLLGRHCVGGKPYTQDCKETTWAQQWLGVPAILKVTALQ
jgi:hypothetical protein